ncbi:arginase family protein [Vibrio crassostreae]|uniref:Arginase n=1 Tax=Vibrio crassostreae TaxID=246167 RepID=A0ABM9QPL5_9VIBR|nr:arginase family protein [Vibrio crassostreae]TCL30377.1 arginase/N-omega-hydroxy-L-arginine amidinohydrolase [Vibrio crassostreae]TCT53488.1 arginase/N-omega-hydroxy-L-arginine amidinohydrolase [Vibrio crassostreae]TCW19131.1 arginase/N-omega-hydroxy-L-arginine amidinohydrolase [Vibrio crassostreae]CAK1862854.1 N(omega)-hydroxy-L-arginine amidinohydrolase [Vibrio crassostreae]CAK1864352.1 N(omega)-hydroxy-L-arginine amidinohydrolase [Vibrio crassostreae]
MSFQILCSQGRVADRSDRMLEGAKLTADKLALHYDLTPNFVGQRSPAKPDDWSLALPEAQKTLDLLQSEISQLLANGDHPVLFASNTCSASLATLPVVAATYPDVKVLWIDAHSDFNTPDTTATGYLGGMVLAATCGLWESGFGSGLKPNNVALIGVHDIDEEELNNVNSAGVKIFPPSTLTPESIIHFIGDSKVWIHVDWDVMDPGQISADFKVEGGLKITQLLELFELLPSNQIMGLELAEFCADSHSSVANLEGLDLILQAVDTLFKQNKSL